MSADKAEQIGTYGGVPIVVDADMPPSAPVMLPTPDQGETLQWEGQISTMAVDAANAVYSYPPTAEVPTLDAQAATPLAWSEPTGMWTVPEDGAQVLPYSPPPSHHRRGIVLSSLAMLASGASLAGVLLWAHLQSTAQPTPQPAPPAAAVAPAPPAHVFDGLFRVAVDNQEATSNDMGGHIPDNPDEEQWWAFQSSCDGQRCTTVGQQVDDQLTQVLVASPGKRPTTMTLTFSNGSWAQEQPDTNGSVACPGGGGTRTQIIGSWTFQTTPDPDVLTGLYALALPTGACGYNDAWIRTPLQALRVGDVPEFIRDGQARKVSDR